MNANEVTLSFVQNQNRATGRPYGLTKYNEQVKGKINTNEEFTIIFPSQINYVSGSFVQGLFQPIITEISLEKTVNLAKIKAKSTELENKIYSDLKTNLVGI